jgi:hypothetical protein
MSEPENGVSHHTVLPGSRNGGAPATRSALPALWMAIVVERACTAIWRAWEQKSDVTELRVNPAVYRTVALARPGEVSRGYPLMLLGLELVPDDAVQIYEPVVTTS